MKKLFLVDAYALIFKFYYAFISRPMRNSEGLNTSAIFGFAKFISDLISAERPDYLGVAFDPKGGNFRHQLYPLYKANRSATPEDICASVPYIKEILEAMKVPVLEVPGYEADDVIGTIAKRASCDQYRVYMVTPDKDYGQLVDTCVFMYKPRHGDGKLEVVDMEAIKAKYRIDHPEQVIDILALWGDSSDNVPGVPGIGEKGAIKLVSEFGGVDGILANLDKLKGKQRENIEQNREQLLLARRLVTIDTHVPIEFAPQKLVLEEPDYERLKAIYTRLGFTTLLRELNGAHQLSGRLIGERLNGGIAPLERLNPDDDLPFVEEGEPNLFSQLAAPAPKPAVPAPVKQETVAEPDLFSVEPMESVATVAHEYRLVTPENIDALAEQLRRSGEFCFDTETTGLDPLASELVGLSFATRAHEAFYLPFDPRKDEDIWMLAKLKPLFEDPSIAKIGQNIKFDMLVLRCEGIAVRGTLYDTMVIHYLINSDERHNMDYLSEKYLKYSPVPIESLIGKGKGQLSMRDVPVERVLEYAAEDADVTFRLKQVLWAEAEQLGLAGLYFKVEEPLIPVLADMEWNGVKVDRSRLDAYAGELEQELARLEAEIAELTGVPEMNVNSPKQLGEVLFEQLKIIDKPKKTKTKQYKTDEEYLQSLSDKHPVIPKILEYRGVKKLLSTYVTALPQLINPRTGRIHTSYNQAVTTTGRLSSTNPNLQNIPIREEQGRKIREAFVADGEDKVLLSADYSQVELRIMAHLSGDRALIGAFNLGEDIHAATAAKIYGIPLAEVTPEERRKAKTANFGIIYGISVFGLSGGLSIPRTEAKELIDGYFRTYPGVHAYMERSIETAREKGYAETIYQRRRYLPDIHSANSVVKSYAERNAINAPIQGSAADIIKIAMAALYKRLEASRLESRIILQVHDELVLEVPVNELEEVKQVVREAMEGAAQLAVALIVDEGSGRNWLEAH